jgi:cytochrome c5
MNEFIKKMMSSKQFKIMLGIVIVFALVAGAYTAIMLQSNIQKMAILPSSQGPKEAAYFPDYPPMNTQGKDAKIINRGEYLAKAGDCIACHTNTPVKGTQFAGGLAMPTPFGTIYSPNITPDKETGIGGWTDEQFIKAMREGISPQGHYYYPAFPYYYFSQVSTDDLKALKAYLDSIPAVHQNNRKNEMMMPFNIRFLQLGWRILFFHPKSPEGFETDTKATEQWNRGAYLVEGLGHCAMCHTPSYYIVSQTMQMGAPMQKYNFSGATVQGYLAPNISQSNIGNVPDQEVVNVFKKDALIGGGNVVGPMLEVNHDSLKYLSDQDLTAMAVYLKSVKSESPPKPKSSGGPGAGTYDTYCSGCHATGAGGAPKFGDASAWDALVKKGGEAQLYTNAIHGINGMPAKGTCISCTDDQIKQAVDYIVNGAKGGTVSTFSAVVTMPPLTMQDGKNVYEKHCSTCHANGTNGAPKIGDMNAWQPIVDKGFMDAYENVVTGRHGHPEQGGCPDCTDAELKAALKYLMQKSSTNNYSLW